MKIALLTMYDTATGNLTTGTRIQEYLEEEGHDVLQIDVVRWPLEKPFDVDCAIGIHAYGAGKYLYTQSFPYAIVFGGTDINAPQPHWVDIMETTIRHAKVLAVFNDDFLLKAQQRWPDAKEKLMNIPQAVETHPSNFSLKKKLNLSPDDVLFLLPAGLRDIKDPLYLMDEISDWHRKDSRIFLVVIGATRDQEYADRLHATAKREHGIIVLDPLPQPDLWAAMQEATAVLNTSKSECSPNSILEAMYVGAPLLVRDIPGNTSIVQHRETGLVFDSPKKFRTGAMELISNILRRNSLIQNAKMAVLQYHNKKQEKEAYLSLLSHLKV